METIMTVTASHRIATLAAATTGVLCRCPQRMGVWLARPATLVLRLAFYASECCNGRCVRGTRCRVFVARLFVAVAPLRDIGEGLRRAMASLGAITLVEYYLGPDLGLNTWRFTSPSFFRRHSDRAVWPGPTALTLLVLGRQLLTTRGLVSQSLASGALAVVTVAIRYAAYTRWPENDNVSAYRSIPMAAALCAALAFLSIAAAVECATAGALNGTRYNTLAGTMAL